MCACASIYLARSEPGKRECGRRLTWFLCFVCLRTTSAFVSRGYARRKSLPPLFLPHNHTHSNHSRTLNPLSPFSRMRPLHFLVYAPHHDLCTSKRLWRWFGWLCHKHNHPCCVDSTSASTGSKRITHHGWCGPFWGPSAPPCTCPRFTIIFCTRSRVSSFHGEGATCCACVAACWGIGLSVQGLG